jgi:hypothetical protein
MWKEAATEISAPTQTQIPNKSNSANSPAKQPAQVQPVNLGDVPVYGAPISISSDFGKQQADFDRAYAQRHAQEEKQARTERGRADQRRSVNDFHNSKLWKLEYQDNLRSYLRWLEKNDPKWLDKMKGQADRAYGAMTDNGKDFNLNRLTLTDTPEEFQKNIQARTMYRSDIRARELVEYSNLELNLNSIVGKEFNPQNLLSVRHNFDAVFAGKYGKAIAPDKVRLIESEADRVYRQETGTDKVDRSSALWKVLRNVQAVSIFRDLWATVQQPPVQATKTVTGQPLPKLGGFGEGGGPQGALRQETFPSGGYQLPPSGGFGEGPQPKIPNHTGHTNAEKPAVTNVFSSTNQKNPLEPFSGLPKGLIQPGDLNLDSLRNAANEPLGRGGLTKAGRALDKHAAGQRSQDSPFPALSGSNVDKNEMAKEQVNEILDSPDAVFRKLGRGGVEVRLPDGRGVRFNQDGSFSGFVE